MGSYSSSNALMLKVVIRTHAFSPHYYLDKFSSLEKDEPRAKMSKIQLAVTNVNFIFL